MTTRAGKTIRSFDGKPSTPTPLPAETPFSVGPDGETTSRPWGAPPKMFLLGQSIYDVLVEEFEASPRYRDDFALSVMKESAQGPIGFGVEWRFEGTLGFGGKYHLSGGREWVSCYPEDETSDRRAAIDRANNRIAALRDNR